MRFSPVARFVLALGLFAGWVGWLGYLAATKARPVVLSRPQLMVSDADVLAEVSALDVPVVVKEVLHSKGVGLAVGDSLDVPNLKACRRLPRGNEKVEDVPLDWTGPGTYLLPLKKTDDGFAVVDVPPSPGYPPEGAREKGFVRGFPRIYRVDDDLLARYREFREAE
jgi:hypothetical protein